MRRLLRLLLPAAVATLALALLASTPARATTPAPKNLKHDKGARPVAAKRPDASRAGPSYAGREDAMQFADEVAARDGLDPAWVRASIGSARLLPNVPRLMVPAAPGATKNWRAYRGRFVEPVRIAAGVRFWRDNADTLARAEASFGVPAEIIVGIIGVETIYGRNMGSFRVIDALSTLAFDFPEAHPRAAERQAFFRAELESFLVLQNRSGESPLLPLGSYAGAMGMPQFMPSSIGSFAVDFDGDGRIDLVNDPADVIGSVANYFKAFGWTPGMASIFPVRLDPQRLQKEMLLAPDIVPTFNVETFTAAGAALDGEGLAHPGLLALIELQNGGDAPTYVAGTKNFYVITRYNWSSYYAMSVIELGREVRLAMAQ